MTVRIVTDSVSDLPPEVAKELGITVVPLNVRFGTQVYRDGIDLSAEEFYERLKSNRALPVTSVPTPAAYAETYDRLAEEADAILAITVSAKLSGVYAVASQSVGLGFIARAAARAAPAGASLDEVVKEARRNMHRVDMRAAFDTLEYLKRGGRLGKAQTLLGSMLRVNPIIGMKDGEVFPFGRERSRSKAIDHLYQFATGYSHIDSIAVEYAVSMEEAENLIERFSAKVPRERIYRSRASPVIGTHTGPSLLVVAVNGDR
jgi:fatty acid-binding protein DegV